MGQDARGIGNRPWNHGRLARPGALGDRQPVRGRDRSDTAGRQDRALAHPPGFADLVRAVTNTPLTHPRLGGGGRAVVEVTAIRKRYRSTLAVDDVSFDVREGEIFGLIGPNGAGKTTTMECVEGVRSPDRGSISVLGMNPVRDAYR